MRVVTHGEAETMEFAKSLTDRFSAGTVVCLNGQPGAGKTHFVKGVLSALGYAGEVTSPTFAVCHRYEKGLPFPVLHYDLYRIADEDDLCSVGFFEDVNERNCVFIEWSALADAYLETEPVRINIGYGNAPDERIITAEGHGL